jgi:hypothetical protein
MCNDHLDISNINAAIMVDVKQGINLVFTRSTPSMGQLPSDRNFHSIGMRDLSVTGQVKRPRRP